jgi:cytochrome c-type biogenesis protein CcmH/NrfG
VKEAFAALGRLFGQAGRWTESAGAYAMLLGDSPDNFEGHLGMATALVHLNRENDAEPHIKEALRLCPDSADALNNLAWTLATSPAARLRDGRQAVELAKRACVLTEGKETMMMGTLAAAQAEAGDFEAAVATAEQACALATAAGQSDLLKTNSQLLELYHQHLPYHEARQ